MSTQLGLQKRGFGLTNTWAASETSSAQLPVATRQFKALTMGNLFLREKTEDEGPAVSKD